MTENKKKEYLKIPFYKYINYRQNSEVSASKWVQYEYVYIIACFLCIMIFAMNCMSKAVAKINTIWPEPIPQVAGGAKKKAAKGDDSEIAAAIVAAMFKR